MYIMFFMVFIAPYKKNKKNSLNEVLNKFLLHILRIQIHIVISKVLLIKSLFR